MNEQSDNVVPLTSGALSAMEQFRDEQDREMLTILFTDLVGSTKLQSDVGNVEGARVTELHRGIVRDGLAKYAAREIEWAGDSCLAVFTRPSDAVVFALRMQTEHRRVRETEPKLPLVRVGMHMGEIVVKKRHDGGRKSEDLFGLQVSEASRVMSLARGNQTYCTRVVFDNARGALKGVNLEGMGDIVWLNYGPYILEGSEEPLEICEIGSTDVAPLKLPKPTDKCRPALASGATISASIPEPEPKSVRRLSINLPATHPVRPEKAPAGTGTGVFPLALSPDGSLLVYVAYVGDSTQLVKRPMDLLEIQPLPRTEGADDPFFSPDGQWIGFFADGRLKKVPIRGGAPVTLCSAPSPSLGGSWGDNGFIVFASGNIRSVVLHRVSEAGGAVEDITSVDTATAEAGHAGPVVLPRGKGVLFTSVAGELFHTMQVVVLPPDGSAPKILVPEAAVFGFLPTGHLAYRVESGVMLVPFNTDTLELSGSPFFVPPDIMGFAFAFSEQGTLVSLHELTAPEVLPDERRLVWVDRKGNEEFLSAPPRPYRHPRISPDGERVAITIGDPGDHDMDIWLYDLGRGVLSCFTLSPANNLFPAWTPDGQRLVFSSEQEGTKGDLFWQEVDGAGMAERLLESPGEQVAFSLSRDGKYLVFWDEPKRGMGVLSIEGEVTAQTLLEGRFVQSNGDISADGRWIAYNSNESGKHEVFVQAFPGLGKKMQISTDGGNRPCWAPDDTELYYRNGDKMMAVSIETEPKFKAGIPEVLFEGSYLARSTDGRNYDISHDGTRFLMIEGGSAGVEALAGEMSPRREIIVVENWFEEIDHLSPATNVRS